MTNASAATKRRFISGILTQYRTVALEDIVVFHQNDTMLLLVVPLVSVLQITNLHFTIYYSYTLKYNTK